MRFTPRAIALAAAVVVLSADAARAQNVTVTTNFTGDVATSPKADPSGTYTTPPGTLTWRIVWDYGTSLNGVFTADATIGAGGTTTNFAAGTTGTYGPTGAEALKKPLPHRTTVRAQLQSFANNMWSPQATAYNTVP